MSEKPQERWPQDKWRIMAHNLCGPDSRPLIDALFEAADLVDQYQGSLALTLKREEKLEAERDRYREALQFIVAPKYDYPYEDALNDLIKVARAALEGKKP